MIENRLLSFQLHEKGIFHFHAGLLLGKTAVSAVYCMHSWLRFGHTTNTFSGQKLAEEGVTLYLRALFSLALWRNVVIFTAVLPETTSFHTHSRLSHKSRFYTIKLNFAVLAVSVISSEGDWTNFDTSDF